MKYKKQIQCNKCLLQLENIEPVCLGFLKCPQCSAMYENKKPYRRFEPPWDTECRDDMPGAIIQYVPKENKK